MSQGPALKFVVDIQNEEKIEQLTKDINVQEAAIKRLSAQLRQGAISEAQFTAAATPMGAAIAKSTTEMKALQAASAMTGRGMMQLGYAVDDLQYGFNAIVNNIPQIAMGFGATAGIAGGIAVASVAINILIKHWGELADIAKSAWSGGSLEQLAQMRKAAEDASDAFEKLHKLHSKFEMSGAKQITDVIAEHQEQIFKGIVQTFQQNPGLFAAEEIRAINVFKPENFQSSEDKRQAAESRQKLVDKFAAAHAKDLEGRMISPDSNINRSARAEVMGLAKRNPGAFPQGFASDIESASPEGQKRQSDYEKYVDAKKKIEQKIKAADEEHLHRMEKEGAVDKAAEAHRRSLDRQKLEDEKMVLSEQIKRGEHLLTGEGKKQLQDMILGGKAPEESKIMSTKAFADKMLTAGMNSVPKEQLEKLKDMHGTLKDIDKKITDIGRLN